MFDLRGATGALRKIRVPAVQRVAAGEITAGMALEKIHAAQRRVEQINELLRRAGKTNFRHPLSKRCERILAEPIDLASNLEAVALRRQLKQAVQELNVLLNEDFRIVPGFVSAAVGAEAVEPARLQWQQGLPI